MGVKKELESIAKEIDVEIVKYERLTDHQDDWYLYMVLCKLRDDKYATWLANISTRSFNTGNYFEDFRGELTNDEIYKMAEDDYFKRMEKYRN